MNFSHEKNIGKKNYTGLIVVVLFHVVLGWAIVNGMGKRVVAKMTQAVEAEIIEATTRLPMPLTMAQPSTT